MLATLALVAPLALSGPPVPGPTTWNRHTWEPREIPRPGAPFVASGIGLAVAGTGLVVYGFTCCRSGEPGDGLAWLAGLLGGGALLGLSAPVALWGTTLDADYLILGGAELDKSASNVGLVLSGAAVGSVLLAFVTDGVSLVAVPFFVAGAWVATAAQGARNGSARRRLVHGEHRAAGMFPTLTVGRGTVGVALTGAW